MTCPTEARCSTATELSTDEYTRNSDCLHYWTKRAEIGNSRQQPTPDPALHKALKQPTGQEGASGAYHQESEHEPAAYDE